MKTFLISTMLLLVWGEAFCQDEASTLQVYEYKARIKPFLKRWYWSLKGFNPYTHQESLELKTNFEFVYRYIDGYCGAMNYSGIGKWSKEGNRLILQPDENSLLPPRQYLMKNDRLYASQDSLINRLTAYRKK